MKLTFSALFFFFAFHLLAQSPIGVWKTIDDQTGEEKSNIEIYEQSGKIFGKITKIMSADPDTVCDKCSGNKKNQPVMGMVIIEDMTQKDGYWQDGKILDPESGNTYKCVIWFEEGESEILKVRGKHWTGLYRTQTWHRVR